LRAAPRQAKLPVDAPCVGVVVPVPISYQKEKEGEKEGKIVEEREGSRLPKRQEKKTARRRWRLRHHQGESAITGRDQKERV